MSKQLFIEAHEALVEEYLQEHSHATWDEAYNLCADLAYDRMRDSLADRADAARQRQKDEGR